MTPKSIDGPVVSSDPHGHEAGLIYVLFVFAQNTRLLVLAPVLAGLIALGITFTLSPKFTSNTRILSPQQQQSTAAALLGSLGGLAGAAGGLPGIKNPADQWIGLLKSRSIAAALVTQFKLRELYDVEYQFQARDELADNTRIFAGKDGLITIEVEDRDPKRAAAMAEAYVAQLRQLSNMLAVSEAAQRRMFFEQQLKDAKDKLIQAEVALKEGGISAKALKLNPDAALTEIAQIKAQVTAKNVRVAVLSGSMTNANVELQQAQRELTSLKAQLVRAEESDHGHSTSDGAQYVARYRDFKYYETLFDLMARQFELAKADEARDGALIQVVDAAFIPEHKSSPQRALIAILTALVVGILLALGLVIRAFVLSSPRAQHQLSELGRALRLAR